MTGAAALTGCRPEPANVSLSRSFPRPNRFVVSGWSIDPFAMGSYSFLKLGSSSDDRETLAEPVGDRIFFAGEATSVDFPAEVHGALLSGRRAAAEVREETDGTVIIVGAGAAGLAAAIALDDEDYDVIILEGRDRVGGRMRTDTRSLSAPVDLGASWIEGTTGNPLVPLARRFGVKTTAFDWERSIAYDANGNDIDDTSEDLIDEVDFEPGMSIQDSIEDSDVADSPLIDLAVASVIEHELAADADEIDGAAWDEGDELGGGDLLVVGGYQRVAEGMARGLDIRLRTTVDEIRLGAGGVGVEVVTSRKTYRGAAVIVTVPLGVLQASRPRFTPGLPAAKRAAISRLGMGVLSKCVLEFDRVFWDDVHVIDLAGRQPRTQWTEFVNLAPFTGKPIIMGFCAGRSARFLEAAKPAAIAASARSALASIYG